MSLEDFEKLREFVLQNKDLQEELQKITERDAFISRLIEIGAESGLHFVDEDISNVMRENRRVWIERWI